MKKNNNIVSQNKIKRAVKNKLRNQRNQEKLENHIQFLYKLSKTQQVNIEKISAYTRYGVEMQRSPKEVQYIINRLVSLQETNS
jgi:chromosome condensin MukBEF MukE localization factor